MYSALGLLDESVDVSNSEEAIIGTAGHSMGPGSAVSGPPPSAPADRTLRETAGGATMLCGLYFTPNAQTLGSGPVYVFSNGQVIAGRWEHNLAVAPILLVDADGESIPLTPGNTWIELAENTADSAFIGAPIDPTTYEDGEMPQTVIEYPQIVLDRAELAPTDIVIEFADETTVDDLSGAATTGRGCVGEEAGRAGSRGVSAVLTRRRAGRGS